MSEQKDFENVNENAVDSGNAVDNGNAMDNDWRLNGQESYLLGKKIVKVKITFPKAESADDCDHAHCEFCWAKFSNGVDDLHEGYAVWEHEGLIDSPFYGGIDIFICPECFFDFKERFQWVLLNDTGDKA